MKGINPSVRVVNEKNVQVYVIKMFFEEIIFICGLALLLILKPFRFFLLMVCIDIIFLILLIKQINDASRDCSTCC